MLGALLVVAVTGAPGWDRVQESFFDLAAAREALPAVLRGLWLNVRLLVICAIGAMALGLAVAWARTLRGPVFFPVRALATSYTYVFRGMPLIIVLYLFTFGVPGLRLQGTPSVFWCSARPRSSSPTPATWPRCSAPASSRCTRARWRRPGRSA